MKQRYWFTEIILNVWEMIREIFTNSYKKPMPEQAPIEQPIPSPVQPVVPLTPAERLYRAALSCVGTDASPHDVAPDEYGCMETVDNVYRKAFGIFINGTKGTVTVSTNLGFRAMQDYPARFRRVYEPVPGTIVISPTGLSHIRNTPIPNGHTGIVGANGIIYSNNSETGKFDAHFDLESWRERYVAKGGYEMCLFLPTGV